MILEGSELTKDDRESQLYDEFEHFHQNKGETIQGYYVFTKLINDMRNIKMTMPRMQLNSKFVNNMLPEWSRFITEVKLNRDFKESNFDQLYAYLNYVYQPWRAILTLINQCLTGKTSGSDKPRHPVLQMLWGIVTQTNVDYAELLWEEFTQGIQTFFSHKASHKASLEDPKKKVTPLLIPYGRFSK
ncbi:hypothetical protein Tco_0910428, partial [Tanacetum coccineum]